MILASMLNIDSDALECDLAETYHIYEWRELPLKKVALFSAGLRNESRIKMKMSNVKYTFDTLLLSNIADRLSILLWRHGGSKIENKPQLISSLLLGNSDSKNENKSDIVAFSTKEEFEKERKQYLGGD